ncbi:hypothetical protein [Streptomyces sp. NPDC001568]|uniref:hypothetical protein n=1 Tax=Streptomyces sp. NPDC001568 TaxID=3364588 RepID=UPI0036B08AE6
MTDEWYVLIEENVHEPRRVEGTELEMFRWRVAGSYFIDGGEERAVEVAEDAARNYLPRELAEHARSGDVPGRRAFLTRDGAWVVSIAQRGRGCHIRVTVGRLVHLQDESEAPPRSLKEKLRSVVQAPGPRPAPWMPTPRH